MAHMRDHVNPWITIGSANMKDEVEGKSLVDFKHDLNKYHTWILDAKAQIKRDKGAGKY